MPPLLAANQLPNSLPALYFFLLLLLFFLIYFHLSVKRLKKLNIAYISTLKRQKIKDSLSCFIQIKKETRFFDINQNDGILVKPIFEIV